MSFDISKLNSPLDLSSGEWIEDIEDNPGLRLKVRSQRYKFYKAALERASRKAGKRSISDKDFGAILSEYILLDWDFKDADGPLVLMDGGKPLSYSKELADNILASEDEYGIGALWRTAVITASNDLSDRIVSATKDAAGN